MCIQVSHGAPACVIRRESPIADTGRASPCAECIILRSMADLTSATHALWLAGRRRDVVLTPRALTVMHNTRDSPSTWRRIVDTVSAWRNRSHRHRLMHNPGRASLVLPVADMLACEAVFTSHARDDQPFVFDVHVVRRGAARLTLERHRFSSRDHGTVQQWVVTLNNELLKDTGRPRRLLVIINPLSGRRRAQAVFHRTAHLFRLANVVVDVVETQRAGHATHLAQHCLLAHTDGIVVYGGDGTLNEVMDGLAARSDGGQVPVAAVPCGSTDTVACTLHGSRDPATAVMHALLGHRHAMDVNAVLADDEQAARRHFVNVAAHGFLGDIGRVSERMRWLGPLRYEVAGLLAFIRHRRFDMDIDVVRAPPLPASLCRAPCGTCRSTLDPPPARAAPEWETLHGRYQLVALAAIALRNDKSPAGFAPDAHLADGAAQLVLVRACSRLQFLRLLLRIARGADHLALPFVERMSVTAVRFGLVGASRAVTSWIIDGEVHDDATLSVRVAVRSQVMFAAGIEPRTDDARLLRRMHIAGPLDA